MTDVVRGFDTGTLAQPIEVGVNGILSIQDAYVPYFTQPLHGALAIRAGAPSNTVDSRFRVDLGLSGNHYGSIFLRNNTPHGQASNYINFLSWSTSGNSIIATLRAGPDRSFAIRTGSSTVVRTGAANEIPDNQWFRFDWQFTGTTVNWRTHYNVSAASDATPSLSGTFTVADVEPALLVLGCQASVAHIRDWSYDTLRVTNTGTWFGPYEDDTSTISVWNGSSEVPATVTLWNGTSEVPITWDVN